MMAECVAFFLGLFCGFFAGILVFIFYLEASNKNSKKRKAQMIQTETSLIPAKENRVIASVNETSSERAKALNCLIEKINAAAVDGDVRFYVSEEMNDRLERYLTKTEIYNFFSEMGYEVVFLYHYLDRSEINYISWE